jgi:arylsulfatase A-like enzyme
MADRPNVLFIALDDLTGWLGCMGTNPDVKTPNMDRLASEGMMFQNGVCTSPVCNPSRTAILTGMSPATTGCYLLPDNIQNSPVRDQALPMPLHFKQNGYRTMVGGKVDHGNSVDKACQESRGESMWHENGGFFNGQQFQMHSPHAPDLCHVDGFYKWAFHWGPLDEEQAETLSDKLVADWAVEQLEQEYDEPFFLGAGFFRPHVPLIAPKRFFDMYDKDDLTLPETGPRDMDGMPPAARQVALAGYQDFKAGMHRQITDHGYWRDVLQAYLASVSFADHCVGRVLEALDNSPHADNTVVVLWGDNGWSLGDHFHWKKWNLWNSGARVPFIMKAPGMDPGTHVCEEGVGLIDIYPTLVELCDLPDVPNLEGRSLKGLLSGEQAEREEPAVTWLGPGNQSLRTRRWRYTRYCDGSEELYDYENDIDELKNLADDPEFADVKQSLASHLRQERAPAFSSSPAPGATLRPAPGESQWFQGVEDGFAGRPITIRAKVEAGGDGVIVHHGSWFAGYSLYVKDRKLCMGVMDLETPLCWDNLEANTTVVESQRSLPDGLVQVEARLDADGTVKLRMDGEVAGTGRAGGPLSIYPCGMLEAGCYTRENYPAIGDYELTEEFPGSLKDISVSFGD